MNLSAEFGNSSSWLSFNTSISPTASLDDKEITAYIFTKGEFLSLTFLNCVISVVGCPSNFAILLSTLMSYQQPNTNIIALLSLCIADILVCGLFQPLYIYRFNHPDQDSVFVTLQVLIGHLSMLTTLNSLVLISIDRLVAVYRPLRYIVWITSNRMYKVTVLLWLVAGAISFLRIVNAWNGTMKLVVYTYSTVAFLFVVVSCLTIYRTSIKASKRVSTGAGFINMSRNKATRSTLIVMAFFILSWMPHLVAPIIFARNTDEYVKILPWLNTFVNINSASNPFFYYFRYAMFRQTFRRFFWDSYNKVLAKIH